MADSGSDADRLNQRLDVQEHHMAKAFSLVSKVMSMLLPVVHQHARRTKLLQVAQWIAVGNVVLVCDGPFEVGDEQDVQIIGARNLSEITICFVLAQVRKVQMGVRAK